MDSQLTSNAEALRLFFTEDIYLVANQTQSDAVAPVTQEVSTKRNIDVPSMSHATTAQLPMVETPKAVQQQAWQFEFLGKNQKNILILVADQQHKVSTEAGTELLRKLVKAIALTNNDFALVNYANYRGANFQALKSFFNCKLVLSFGVSAAELEIAEQTLHQLADLNGTRLIITKNLHELDGDQMGKKTLWANLQQLK